MFYMVLLLLFFFFIDSAGREIKFDSITTGDFQSAALVSTAEVSITVQFCCLQSPSFLRIIVPEGLRSG